METTTTTTTIQLAGRNYYIVVASLFAFKKASTWFLLVPGDENHELWALGIWQGAWMGYFHPVVGAK